MSIPGSSTVDYFSVEDILTTQERVPCKFLLTVPNLGKLDSSSEDKDLKAGTELELPLWLVQSLSSGRHPIIAPTLPKIFREAYREILKADPCAVDLHKLNLHFHEFGNYIMQFDQRGDVKKCLEQTFQHRFRQLMDMCEYTFIDPVSVDKLDTLERRLYHEGHSARMKLNTWLIESRVPIQVGDMVINHKKRKRIDFEADH